MLTEGVAADVPSIYPRVPPVSQKPVSVIRYPPNEVNRFLNILHASALLLCYLLCNYRDYEVKNDLR